MALIMVVNLGIKACLYFTINYSFKVKQVAKKKLCLANIQIVKMFELFENERTKTIHSSIVHSSEIRDLCLLIGHIFGNQNLLSY